MKNLLNLTRAGAFIALALVIALSVVSCGGGGGSMIPINDNPQTSVLDVAQSYDSDTVILTQLYRAVDDTTPLADGSTFTLKKGEARNFSARAWAKLLQSDGTYRKEEVTAVDGMKFSWAFRGLDSGNAALTGTLQKTLAQVTIAWDDLPAGGSYDLSVRAEIAPQDLVKYVNDRLEKARQQGTGGYVHSGGSSSDDALWAGAGFLLALMLCPSDSAGVTIQRDADGVTPTNHAPTIDPSGPTQVEVESINEWFSGANDVDASDHLVFMWYVDGVVQSGGVAVVNPSIKHQFHTVGTHTISFTVSDGNGGTNNYTWNIQVTVAPPPTRVLDHVTANPQSFDITVGDAPKQLTATAYDTNGVVITSGVVYHWVLDAAVSGSITSTGGLYTAGGDPGTYPHAITVTGTYDGVSKSDQVDVTINGSGEGVIWPIGPTDINPVWYTPTGAVNIQVGVGSVVGYVEWQNYQDSSEGSIEKTSSEPCVLVRYWPGTWTAAMDTTGLTLKVDAKAYTDQASYLKGDAPLGMVTFTIHMFKE